MKKLSLLGMCAFGLLSCSPPGDPELTCDPAPAAATLATNVGPLIEAKCANACHQANDTFGDYSSAATIATIVNRKSVYASTAGTLQVVDGKNKSLANSSLWLKILGGATSGRTGPKGENVYGKMPNDNTMLTDAEKKIFKDWICGGGQ